jgi:uncharacterized protein (TIGR00255 family)
MILSMTGFAVASRDLPGGTLTVEIRTVNHRYLDLQFRLPDELRSLEPGFRERLSAELRRGKIDCRVALARNAGRATALALDEDVVGQLDAVARRVMQRVPGSAPLSVNEILRWPGVLAEGSLSPEELAGAANELLAQALADLRATRAREGAKLAALIEQRCDDIRSQVDRVTPRLPQIQSAFFEKLAARLREAGLSPDDERLKQELALFATRIDVDEEVSRLLAHVDEVRRIVAAGGSAGKRLDFLMQELHREANTLGSKSVDTELTQVAVELKVLIEQMREQVQNIE